MITETNTLVTTKSYGEFALPFHRHFFFLLFLPRERKTCASILYVFFNKVGNFNRHPLLLHCFLFADSQTDCSRASKSPILAKGSAGYKTYRYCIVFFHSPDFSWINERYFSLTFFFHHLSFILLDLEQMILNKWFIV